MAKPPKKVLKTVKSTKPAPKQPKAAVKSAQAAKAPAKAAKTPAKSAKVTKVPVKAAKVAKVPVKAAKATKVPTKVTKAPAPKQQKTAPAKAVATTKTQAAPKAAKVMKSKPPKAPSVPDLERDGIGPGAPIITSPSTGATVSAGVDLTVDVSTNRGDYGYIVTLTNVTPPGPSPAPISFDIPAPAGTTFSTTIPGADLVSGQSYQIGVCVNPTSGPTPPNETDLVSINAE